VAASFANATKVITKSPHEAMGIPTAEANVDGLNITKQLINMLKNQDIPDSSVLMQEIDIINKETSSILEAVFKLGDGNIAEGAIRAFASGVLDIPFAPSKSTLGLILPVRDQNGAVRFFNFGNLPFDNEIKEFHKKKIEERAKAEKRAVSFKMITDDIYAISKGQLVGTRR
jgi:methylaspartate mutase epsilon subunit